MLSGLFSIFSGSMKELARSILIIFWLAAIVAPNIIPLFDVDNLLIVNNLDEEEQQETEKKLQGDEKIVFKSNASPSFLIPLNKRAVVKFHDFNYVNYTLEIVVPPPNCIA